MFLGKITEMKIQLLDEFVGSIPEEKIWELIEDYEEWKRVGSDENRNFFLRDKAREYCEILTMPAHYHTDFMTKIAMYAYRHFALKYKEIMK